MIVQAPNRHSAVIQKGNRSKDPGCFCFVAWKLVPDGFVAENFQCISRRIHRCLHRVLLIGSSFTKCFWCSSPFLLCSWIMCNPQTYFHGACACLKPEQTAIKKNSASGIQSYSQSNASPNQIIDTCRGHRRYGSSFVFVPMATGRMHLSWKAFRIVDSAWVCALSLYIGQSWIILPGLSAGKRVNMNRL